MTTKEVDESLPECANCTTIRCLLNPDRSKHYTTDHQAKSLKKLNPRTNRCDNYFGTIRLAFTARAKGE